MPRRNGYYAVVLDNESANRLKALAVHTIVHCHHLTLSFRPEIGSSDDVCWSSYAGGAFGLHVTGIAKDEYGQAAYVPNTPAANKFPHVTISCAEGVPPVYSNELLEKAVTDSKVEPLDMRLTGVIQFVSLGGEKKNG